jgi:hypothetical protein
MNANNKEYTLRKLSDEEKSFAADVNDIIKVYHFGTV